MPLTEDVNVLINELNNTVDIIEDLKKTDIIYELDQNSQDFKNIKKQAENIENQETIVRQKIHIMESLLEPQDAADLKKYVTKKDIQKRDSIFFATRNNATKELNKLYDMVETFEDLIEKEYD